MSLQSIESAMNLRNAERTMNLHDAEHTVNLHDAEHTIPVMIDADNTLGVPGCDVDDGLALLYILGNPQVNLVGIGCSFGNSTQEIVYNNTLQVLHKWNRSDIPVYRGADTPLTCIDDDKIAAFAHTNKAACALVDAANSYPGSLCVLATGSLTNLACAALIDPTFFSKLKTVSLMGGLIEPLIIYGKQLDELNFSVDAYASEIVLAAQDLTDLRVAHAQTCLDSLFDREDLANRAQHAGPHSTLAWINHACQYWYELQEEDWGLDTHINWDVLAAVALTVSPSPHSLEAQQDETAGISHHAQSGVKFIQETINPRRSLISGGYLTHHPACKPLINDPDHVQVTERTVWVPQIIDHTRYVEHVYDTYKHAQILR